MIREILNFIKLIEKNDLDYFTANLNPTPGLHIFLQLSEQGKVIENSYDSYVFKKNGIAFKYDKEGNEILVDCTIDFAKLEYYSSPVSMNKAIDIKKQIHSTSPYIIWFKKEKYSNTKDRIKEYYQKVMEYSNSQEIEQINLVEEFVQNKLFMKIKDDINYEKIKAKDYIKVYFDVPLNNIITVQNNYLKEKLFVSNNFNISSNTKETFGLSGFLNGANVKKKFIQHQTANYLVNNRIDTKQAVALYKFEKLLKSKPRKLPNPLPIFIEREELNNQVLRLYGTKGIKRFQAIIRDLYENKSDDLTNYYLFNWSNTKNGLVINDIDFVSSFKYKIHNLKLQNVMKLENVLSKSIENVFQFELEILQPIFNNSLIVKTKKGDFLFKYFDEIDYKFCSKTTYLNIMNYRLNFYNFIYKSKKEAVTKIIFYRILISEILNEIKNSEFNKTWEIKEKLNILFSINQFFDKTNKNFGGINMASQIPKYLSQLREIISNEEKHLPDDDYLFAFAAGQLIYYIIYQSQAANKTHALLEPYISKTEPKQFKTVITRGIEQYKHSLNFGHIKLEKLVSEVLGYESKIELKKLQPVILAGYFSNSLLLEKKQSN
ncbi:MAG: hypothetical protein CR986_08140 [Ignavibacteriae bacterium]|nr:MAG: hypothetical protein CR986_08140 [Ignavibacteriota bacterium]